MPKVGKIVNVLRRIGSKNVDAMLLGRIVDGKLIVWWRRQIELRARRLITIMTSSKIVANIVKSFFVKKIAAFFINSKVISASASEIGIASRVCNDSDALNIAAPAEEITGEKAICAAVRADVIPAPASEFNAEKAICFSSDILVVPAPTSEIDSENSVQFANTVELENSKIVDLSDGRNIAVNLKSVLDNCIPTDIRINHFEKTRIKALLENVWLNKLYFRKSAKIEHNVNIEALPVESFNSRKDIKNGLTSKLYNTATKTLKKIKPVSVSVGAPLESHTGGTIFGKKKATSILKAKSEAVDAGENRGIKVIAPVVSAEAYHAKGTGTESKKIIELKTFAGIGFTPPVWFDPHRTGNDLYIRSANSILQDDYAIWIDPWFAYEAPVQIDNTLYVTEVIDVTINNNTAEVI